MAHVEQLSGAKVASRAAPFGNQFLTASTQQEFETGPLPETLVPTRDALVAAQHVSTPSFMIRCSAQSPSIAESSFYRIFISPCR